MLPKEELRKIIDADIERFQRAQDYHLQNKIRLDEPRYIVVNKNGEPVSFTMENDTMAEPIQYWTSGDTYGKTHYISWPKDEAQSYCDKLKEHCQASEHSKDETFYIEETVYFCNTRLHNLWRAKEMIPYLSM